MTRYCGDRKTIGHGEVAICGEVYYTEVHQCDACKLKEMEAQRELIAQYLYSDPPFDECAGIDIHLRASEYGGEEPGPNDYYRAFLDCCEAALEDNLPTPDCGSWLELSKFFA